VRSWQPIKVEITRPKRVALTAGHREPGKVYAADLERVAERVARHPAEPAGHFVILRRGSGLKF
jgi:hypothetical protein